MVTKKKPVKRAAPAQSVETAAPAFKPKKSVALSGVTAGNTALCTVGRSGNDLHYRGYDILDFADTSEFEEIAHLLIHGKLPNKAELAASNYPGITTRREPSHGRHAHRRVRTWLHSARKRRPQYA
jgi:2-methylcitrate synthase